MYAGGIYSGLLSPYSGIYMLIGRGLKTPGGVPVNMAPTLIWKVNYHHAHHWVLNQVLNEVLNQVLDQALNQVLNQVLNQTLNQSGS